MIVVALAATAGMIGCGGDIASGSALGETDQPREQLVEVEVGTFSVPLAIRTDEQEEETGGAVRHGLLLRFRLLVVVPPHREDDVVHRVATHGARLREEVVQTCRAASLDELSEPALGTLKRELTRVLARYLGGKYLRRVVLNNVLLEAT